MLGKCSSKAQHVVVLVRCTSIVLHTRSSHAVGLPLGLSTDVVCHFDRYSTADVVVVVLIFRR